MENKLLLHSFNNETDSGIIIITCGFLCEREVFDQNAHKTTNNFISNDESDAEIKGTFEIIMIVKNS